MQASHLSCAFSRRTLRFFKIDRKCVPVEMANLMSYVVLYHTPILHAYKIVITESHDLDAEAALRTAVKYVNHSIGPDGLSTTLFVYGAL